MKMHECCRDWEGIWEKGGMVRTGGEMDSRGLGNSDEHCNSIVHFLTY